MNSSYTINTSGSNIIFQTMQTAFQLNINFACKEIFQLTNTNHILRLAYHALLVWFNIKWLDKLIANQAANLEEIRLAAGLPDLENCRSEGK